MPSKPPIAPTPPDLPEELEPFELAGPLARGELEAVHLDGVDLSDHDASRLALTDSRLDRVDLSSAGLQHATVRDVIVTEGSWSNLRACGITLRRAHLAGVRLTGADLAGSTIEDATFADCRIDLASFRSAKLTRVRFERCRLDEADFQAATFTSCVFSDCTLTRAALGEATFARSEVRGCDLGGIGNPERLRGVRMGWGDVVNAAAELAEASGIEVVDES